MSFDKKEILQLNTEERRLLAFELLDSIDEEFVNQPMQEWKRNLIQERMDLDKSDPSAVVSWNELRKKYYGQ